MSKLAALEMYLDVIEQRNSLQEQVNELKETLTFAAQYKGIEGRSCPLCKYEAGIFIGRCQMHKDMDEMMIEINRLRRKAGEELAYLLTEQDLREYNERQDQ